jgi:hypothetical protein
MAQQIAWTTTQVPGSLAVTGNPADSTSHQQSADGRCPRCERNRWEVPCAGVLGEVNHLGN